MPSPHWVPAMSFLKVDPGVFSASFNAAVDEQISARHKEDRYDTGNGKATENCPRKPCVLFTTRFQREGHRAEPEHSGRASSSGWAGGAPCRR